MLIDTPNANINVNSHVNELSHAQIYIYADTDTQTHTYTIGYNNKYLTVFSLLTRHPLVVPSFLQT